MDFLDAAVAVLRDEGTPLHWTVVQDLALQRGYLDPFTQPNLRSQLRSALSRAVEEGVVVKAGKGVYAIADPSER